MDPGDRRGQEPANMSGDHRAVLFQREMPGIQQMELEILQVPLVRIGALGGKDVVVLSPDDQSRWLVILEVLLPLRAPPRIKVVVGRLVTWSLGRLVTWSGVLRRK